MGNLEEGSMIGRQFRLARGAMGRETDLYQIMAQSAGGVVVRNVADGTQKFMLWTRLQDATHWWPK